MAEPEFIGASVVARRIGVPVERVIDDIRTGIAGCNYLAFSGTKAPIIGWCVEGWEMAGDRPAYHAKRLAGGSAAQRFSTEGDDRR